MIASEVELVGQAGNEKSILILDFLQVSKGKI